MYVKHKQSTSTVTTLRLFGQGSSLMLSALEKANNTPPPLVS